jgi:hypothetical protein
VAGEAARVVEAAAAAVSLGDVAASARRRHLVDGRRSLWPGPD